MITGVSKKDKKSIQRIECLSCNKEFILYDKDVSINNILSCPFCNKQDLIGIPKKIIELYR